MMLIVTGSAPSGRYFTDVCLAMIVMPFSRSRSMESITRSAMSWLGRNAPDCHSIASTNVVFPWSTWATIARFRRSVRAGMAILWEGGPVDITLEELFAQTNPDPKTAIGYRRVSSLREKKKHMAISTEIQTEYIEAAAARDGIRIVDWVDDMNISGRREQFLRRKVLPT